MQKRDLREAEMHCVQNCAARSEVLREVMETWYFASIAGWHRVSVGGYWPRVDGLVCGDRRDLRITKPSFPRLRASCWENVSLNGLVPFVGQKFLELQLAASRFHTVSSRHVKAIKHFSAVSGVRQLNSQSEKALEYILWVTLRPHSQACHRRRCFLLADWMSSRSTGRSRSVR